MAMDAETLQVISGLIVGLLGGGTIKSAIDHFGRWKREKAKLKAANEEREDSQKFQSENQTIIILQDALKVERETNARYLERLYEQEAEIKELRQHLEIMRRALLANFIGDNEKAIELVDSIPTEEITKTGINPFKKES